MPTLRASLPLVMGISNPHRGTTARSRQGTAGHYHPCPSNDLIVVFVAQCAIAINHYLSISLPIYLSRVSFSHALLLSSHHPISIIPDSLTAILLVLVSAYVLPHSTEVGRIILKTGRQVDHHHPCSCSYVWMRRPRARSRGKPTTHTHTHVYIYTHTHTYIYRLLRRGNERTSQSVGVSESKREKRKRHAERKKERETDRQKDTAGQLSIDASWGRNSLVATLPTYTYYYCHYNQPLARSVHSCTHPALHYL
ncbi:hypothetical protein F5Y10DRAFT_205460 [Nemania abortiva]|nr:hypothetical protein F5Y10DRAFT_205460 [Nemania abortiva]